MNFGCWNVQGINTKCKEVFDELYNFRMDITVLTETKKKGNGNELQGDFIHFYSGVEKSRRAKAGVSIAIRKELKNRIKNWSAIDERIITLELVLSGQDIVVIGVYSPTDDASLQEKDEFTDKLTQVVDNIGNGKEIVMMGDFNGRVGCRRDHDVVGQYGEDVLNDNGSRLIELCDQFSLKILNGYFQHKRVHRYTWTQPTKGQKSIIDYVITKQMSRAQVTDVRVHRGANCGSDHFLLRAIMQFKFYHRHICTSQQQAKKIQCPKYNLNGFLNDSTVFLYKMRLAEMMRNVKDGNAEDCYNFLKDCIHQAAFESLGEISSTKPRSSSCYWWNEELEEVVSEKRALYQKWLATGDREDRRMYARCNYLVKKLVKQEKNSFWEKKCSEVDQQLGSSRSRAAWKTLKALRTNTREKRVIDPIEMEDWMRYYEGLLTEDRGPYNKVSYETETLDSECEDITMEDVCKALRSAKNNKSAGPGGVSIELVKNAPIVVIEALTSIFNKCLRGEEVPSEWKMAFITSIFKKGDKTVCSNYRGISVTASIGRLYGRILKERIENQMTEMEEQSGFRSGRSCIDNVFCLKQLTEKLIACGSEVHMIFIDLKKAYDSVPVNRLWEAMERNGVDKLHINLVKKLYENTKSCVKTSLGYSESFVVNKGLRQGCCLSPTLFKIYMNVVLSNWSRKCSKMGIQLEDGHLYTLLFADDQVVLAEDEDDASYMVRKLIEEYDDWGLEINLQKTQYMVVGGQGNDIETPVGTIKVTKDYKYLGVTLTDDGLDEKDILSKMGQGRGITRQLHSVLWSKAVSNKTKVHMFKSLVESCITYGSEVWTVNRRLQHRINAVEMAFWRRSCGVTLFDHIRNEEIRERVGIEAPLTESIEAKQLLWYGHMRRMPEERLPAKIWRFKPRRRRKRGRPRRMWLDGVEEAMERRNLEEQDCHDREKWRMGCGKRPEL